MAVYNKVTKEKYEIIKILLKGGASVQEISDYIQLSAATIYQIKVTETFEEYENISVAKAMARKAAIAIKKQEEQKQETKPEVKPEVKKEEPKPMNPTVIKVEATHYMMQELQNTNRILTDISRKLAAIVEDLYGVNKNAESDH